ncbi:MAG: YvcK family protein [Candidatus Omnitrophica bacterium]|nr:YvcK family protein [Candidatus Omnitrophota bacterium]
MKRRFDIIRPFKWLYPGMRVKRWIVLTIFGVSLIVFGSAKFLSEIEYVYKFIDAALVTCGLIFLYFGIKKMLRSFITLFLPQSDKELLDIMFRTRLLQRGPRIVVIGGGSGLSVILRGLKEFTSNITAIVTVADDGGSSGRLREQFDILPPGDIRNCLVALADAPALMQDLFQFRFNADSEFAGHSFGNLFITVMTQLTGDFDKAVKESSRVLAIRGKVVPSTLNKVVLVAEHKNGAITEGEAEIPKKGVAIKRVYLKPDTSTAAPEALKAISEADAIVLGPGSLYTSIIPNLLIKDIVDALLVSPALKVYICNVMTQPGETDNFSCYDHVKTLIDHSHPKIIDYCVVNKSRIPEALLEKYKMENSYPITVDANRVKSLGCGVIEGNFVSALDYVRHDPEKLGRVVINLVAEEG